MYIIYIYEKECLIKMYRKLLSHVGGNIWRQIVCKNLLIRLGWQEFVNWNVPACFLIELDRRSLVFGSFRWNKDASLITVQHLASSFIVLSFGDIATDSFRNLNTKASDFMRND